MNVNILRTAYLDLRLTLLTTSTTLGDRKLTRHFTRVGAPAWTLEGAYGAVQSYGVAQQGFDDPASATYDCGHNYVLADAPGDTDSVLMRHRLVWGSRRPAARVSFCYSLSRDRYGRSYLNGTGSSGQ